MLLYLGLNTLVYWVKYIVTDWEVSHISVFASKFNTLGLLSLTLKYNNYV